jgi:hypothetical protein
MDHAPDRARHDLATRRAALDDALAALDRGDPDADPIAVVDCALALQAAEAVAAVAGARGAGAAAGARQPVSAMRT